MAYWNTVAACAGGLNEGQPRVFEQISPTLRGMRSGANGFAETAELDIGLRLPPGLGVQASEAALRELLADAELTLVDGVPAYRAEKNTPLVRAFLAAIRHAGGDPSFTVKTGTSDMNVVAPLWGTPILAYGPGDSSLDHTPHEHILVPEYLKAVEVLSQVLVTLAGAASL